MVESSVLLSWLSGTHVLEYSRTNHPLANNTWLANDTFYLISSVVSQCLEYY